jgi:hypothetical protein
VGLALATMPCFACVGLGQTPPLVVAGVVAALWMFSTGRDRLAGAALALAVVKPQLAVVVVPALLLWGARRGRWGAVAGFAATLGGLCLVSTLARPDWPVAMLAAPSRIPIPTAIDPRVGVTWLSACRALGLSGAGLAAAYLAGATAAALVALRAAWSRAADALDVAALGLLAAFFAAPYALGYDLAALLVPLAALARGRSARARVAVAAVAVLGPYWHLAAVSAGLWQTTLLAWPVALAGVWAALALRPPLQSPATTAALGA